MASVLWNCPQDEQQQPDDEQAAKNDQDVDWVSFLHVILFI